MKSTSQEKPLQNGSFHHEMLVNASVVKVFNSITKEIPLWWTEMFEGSSDHTGDVFTVRFGSLVFKTMLVQELNINKKIVWLVTDTLIDVPELTNKREWLDTRIIWELTQENENTLVRLTHLGLNHDIECYEMCSGGWRQFCNSLKSHLEKGFGVPFKLETSNV